MKLHKKFNGERDVPIEGHFELIDQIRIRSKSDGIAFHRPDEECNTGQYFQYAWRKRRAVNLKAVARAVAFFGGTLVIDWNDR